MATRLMVVKIFFLQKEKEITIKEFNVITGFLQPKEGKFRFREADEMVNFAIKNDLKVVGHTVVEEFNTRLVFQRQKKIKSIGPC